MVSVKSVYLVGSLRNPKVPELARQLRRLGLDVFDDWHAAGPEADDHWRAYEKARGHTFQQALRGYVARHAFGFDKSHLDRCDAVVLVMPAGKSGHLELGYGAGYTAGWLAAGGAGPGKLTIIYLDGEPERWDMMYRFADVVCVSRNELFDALVDPPECVLNAEPEPARDLSSEFIEFLPDGPGNYCGLIMTEHNGERILCEKAPGHRGRAGRIDD